MKNYSIHFSIDGQKRWVDLSGTSLKNVRERFFELSFAETGRLVQVITIYPNV